MKMTLTPQQTSELWKYVFEAIHNTAKSEDRIKEYVLAKLMQCVMHKLEILLLRYKQANSYRSKQIALTELETLAMNCYFSRYAVPAFLLPVEHELHEHMRFKFPQMVDLLAKRIDWNQFVSESSYPQ